MTELKSSMDEELFGFHIDKKWDYENGFYLTSHTMRLGKMLAHYELYKSIIDLPGHIVECGVYKGASIIRFATFREILETQFSRKIIGFDIFGKFPQQQIPEDSAYVQRFEQAGGNGIPSEELEKVFLYKSIENFELIPGNILETVPQYINKNPELKIALLHIDVDVYQPTLVILEHLFDRVVKGGLVVLDDYGTVAGETNAVDEFFEEKGTPIKKLSISHVPSYIIK